MALTFVFWVLVPVIVGYAVGRRYADSSSERLTSGWLLVGLVLWIPSAAVYVYAALAGNIFELPGALVAALIFAFVIGWPLGLLFISATVSRKIVRTQRSRHAQGDRVPEQA